MYVRVIVVFFFELWAQTSLVGFLVFCFSFFFFVA